MKTFDALIVGGGLAGNAAAIFLARRGFFVALLEAGTYPRHKVCGEFLSGESRAIFARLGVETALLGAKPVEISRARIVAGARSAVLPLPTPAWALSRLALDAILWREAQKIGVQTFENTKVRGLERRGKNWFAATNNGEFSARAALQTTGRAPLGRETPHTSPARYIGLKAHFSGVEIARGEVELHPFRGGYCGLVEVETGAINACLLARYETLAGRAPADFWDAILEQNRALKLRFAHATPRFDWIATANVAFGDFSPARDDGLLRAGDAAGNIHQLSGDGQAMALRAGELAGAVLSSQLQNPLAPHDAARLYHAAWQREFSERLNTATKLQPLLISPQLAKLGVAVLNAAPFLAPKIVSQTRGAL